MRIGIVTQPLYANYGGILQNYALQQVLKKMGHEPVTLDQMPSLPFWRYCLYAGKTLICAFIPSKRHPLKPYSHFLKRPEAINQFVESYIAHTKTVASYSARQLSKYGIEAVLVGSDQVWRYKYNNETIEDKYLAFAKDYDCLKIAYAASFGVDSWDYPEDVTPVVKDLVRQFNAVSVRETSASVLCRNILGVEAPLVLDPTLLLIGEDYLSLCAPEQMSDGPYLASYVLDADKRKQAMIERFAEENGLPVRNMTVSENGCSIGEWLSTIRNAEYVITDSYHGSIFSILFRKQFYTFDNKDRGADRFYTLFRLLGLTSRLLDDNISELPDGEVDYSSVESKLDSYKEHSVEFLKGALK